MKLNQDIILTPARDAASVVLLRDAADDLEVFLLRRHSDSEVLGGVYVFPGGKVDVADRAMPEACLDQSGPLMHQALGETGLLPQQATALFVAALREAFEECGVLLVHTELSPDVLAQARALHAQGLGFAELLQTLGLQLHTQGLQPWSRWITSHKPALSNKRFDVRFFVATMPPAQTAAHDNHEATESVWLTPRLALSRYWDRQIMLAPPQIMSLVHLSRHRSVQSVRAEARLRGPVVVQTEPTENAQGERVLRYPGDPEHSQAQRVMPGPTRLYHRNQRFEPEGGFDALFADAR